MVARAGAVLSELMVDSIRKQPYSRDRRDSGKHLISDTHGDVFHVNHDEVEVGSAGWLYVDLDVVVFPV